jgi:hypothetical protein
MRKKLNDNEKKQPISVKVDPVIYNELNKLKNKSKYIEYLIYKDMKDKGVIKDDIIL